MSSTMETSMLNSDRADSRLTWKDIAYEKWRRKAEHCPSKGKIAWDRGICFAVPKEHRCDISICPFAYWSGY